MNEAARFWTTVRPGLSGWALAMVGCLLFGVAQAQDGESMERLIQVFREGSHKWAMRGFLERARLKDVWAQAVLCRVYREGEGNVLDAEQVKPDDVQAAFWCREAAKQGDVDSKYWIGRFYELGRGLVQSDPGFAFEWYEEAAEGGHPQAAYRLCSYYRFGDGAVEPSWKDAVRHCEVAAYGGVPEAQNALGQLYEGHDGVRSYAWYVVASASGSQLATWRLEQLEMRGESPARSEGLVLANRLRSEIAEKLKAGPSYRRFPFAYAQSGRP